EERAHSAEEMAEMLQGQAFGAEEAMVKEELKIQEELETGELHLLNLQLLRVMTCHEAVAMKNPEATEEARHRESLAEALERRSVVDEAIHE
ncbi:unnamed protein product, partial [Durusdinium trenchii]